ncbi:MAG: hypothetical protein HQL56_13020 [Magnetococcales bacterium]|nr:hypothetical protein [Magnetococcales bacterium]
MTSPSSSISNFEARRFFLTLGAAIGLFLGVAVAISYYLGFKQGMANYGFQVLLDYQKNKIRQAQRVDIVFLGDSSLGNAIDAAHFTRLSGRDTLNLALTGSFGYAGSLNLLRQVLARHEPKVVVLLHTVDMMSRKLSYLGYFQTTDFFFNPFRFPPEEVTRFFLNSQTITKVIQRLWERATAKEGVASGEDYLYNDYIVQKGGTDAASFFRKHADHPLTPAQINPEKILFLQEIPRLCREAGIACIYVHGPTTRVRCDNSADFLQAATAMIRQLGLTVLEEPACMPMQDLGDSDDHVSPSKKQAYTEYYYGRLRAFLMANGGVSP